MAKYDLDAAHSDPYARRTNKFALAGLTGMLGLLIAAGWIQAHPYQTSTEPIPSWWHATIAYGGQLYDAAGPVTPIPVTQMRRVGQTRDGRDVFEPVGGGGGGGKPVRFVQMSVGLYLPIKPHSGPAIPDSPIDEMYRPERPTRLQGGPPPGLLP